MVQSKPWILGIGSSHNGAACLLHGAEIEVAIQEERLLRCKRAEHPAAFPSLAIAYCLNHAGLTAGQLDAVVTCASAPTRGDREDVYLNSQLQVGRNRSKVFTIPHHLGHAVAVYMLSGMCSAGVLVVDGNGSPYSELLESERAVIVPGQLEFYDAPVRTIPREHISLYTITGDAVTPVEKHIASYAKDMPKPKGIEEFQTLGDMYGFVGKQVFGGGAESTRDTRGFDLEGAGKIMGLAPYGKPTIPTDDFYRITSRGFEFQEAVRLRFQQNDRWPACEKEYADLAASVQKALEEAVLFICKRLRQSNENLCYAGGVALNSVANERIVREAGFRDVFIMPAAEDSGTAIGAAYYGLWQLCGYSRRTRQVLDSMGKSYEAREISTAIQALPGFTPSKNSNSVEEAANLLSQGRIVGWFQGGSELGPRALGQRSILCDPRSAEMKNIVNQKVKFRESFRPFAPMVLEEDVYEWFDVERPYGHSPFMLRVLPFRRERAHKVPAVVHVDGTGRVQTVSKEHQPLLHRLLSLFKKETGIPILLNTSFNIAGEPIVETPADALWCCLFTGMDACILQDHIVLKSPDMDILDYPLSVRAQALLRLNTRVDGRIEFGAECLPETALWVVSGHLSRISDLGLAVRYYPWLKMLAVVGTAWGQALHGLPGGLMQILELVDGRRTGREIYAKVADGLGRPSAAVAAETCAAPAYPLSQFRKHLGILKRIGAIELRDFQESHLGKCSSGTDVISLGIDRVSQIVNSEPLRNQTAQAEAKDVS